MPRPLGMSLEEPPVIEGGRESIGGWGRSGCCLDRDSSLVGSDGVTGEAVTACTGSLGTLAALDCSASGATLLLWL